MSLKTFEFGEMVMFSQRIDGSTVITLLCEDDKNYAIHLKPDFTGDTVYIRDERDVMEKIAEAEWKAIHNEGYDITTNYDAVYDYMSAVCEKLVSEGKLAEYTIYLDRIIIETARGIEYEYPLGNPSSYDLLAKVFENLNTPNQEYNARNGR